MCTLPSYIGGRGTIAPSWNLPSERGFTMYMYMYGTCLVREVLQCMSVQVIHVRFSSIAYNVI